MVDTFKVYLYAFLGIITLGIFTYIKYLRDDNKRKQIDISTLESNIETQRQVHGDDILRERFNATQKAKSTQVKDELKIDKIDKERGDVESNTDFIATSV